LPEDRVPRAVLVLEPRPRAADRAPPLAPGRRVAIAVAGARGRAVAEALKLDVALSDAAFLEDALEDAHGAGSGPALPPETGALIDLRALDAPRDAAGALASAKASFFLAQRARPLLLESARAGGAFYVTATTLGASHPITGGVHGLLKTAALEWPEVACAVIDVDARLDVAAALREELYTGFLDVEVVRAAEPPNARLVPVVVERPVLPGPAGRAAPRDGAVWVASGGARGVTATTLLALAKQTRPSLLLLGRTPLGAEPACCAGALDEASLKKALVEDARRAGRPLQLAAIGEEARRVLAVREIAGFIGALERAGARVLYRAVDVRDAASVAGACAEARATFGPITGIVHGAGVLADKRIEDKSAEQVDRVIDTKVLGLTALLDATRHDPLDAVLLFSSVAGRFGNIGQVDYAMANEMLNEMAVRLASERTELLVKSLNWGPWEGGMVTPALKELFAARGVRVLSHADGARHFLDELAARDGVVEVVFGGALGADPDTAPASAPVGSAARRAEPAPATSGLGPRGKRFLIDEGSWPFLADHAVKGTVVLPVVGALELFARASSARIFEDVRVLRGVRLPRFSARAGGGVELEVAREGARLALFVAGEERPSYTARVGAPAAPLAPWAAPAVEPPRRGPLTADLYEGPLFHGPRFHLVDAVEGVGEAGLVARVRGCLERDWGDGLEIDMGALDAALQAALLWTRHTTGGAFLPTAIARVRVAEPVLGPMRLVLVRRALEETHGVCDVQLLDLSGRVAFELQGVTVHRLPEDDAFAPVAASTAAGGVAP
jgi:NADP-dependent 3-hydroxy acid dehydrogenase YdfG